MASVSRALQLPQDRPELALVSSKRDLPLSRAEPESDAGWASEAAFRKGCGKKLLHNSR